MTGGLGQMLCSCGSFSMIYQWSRTDLENCLPSDEYGFTTGRTDLELDALRFCREECHESGGEL